MDVKTKKCRTCKNELSIEMFSKQKSSKDGVQSQCKRCNAIYTETHKYKKHGKSLLYDSTMKGRYIQWRRSAKIRDIPFELSLQDVESMPMVCHYTGVSLVLTNNSYYTVSLDRLDSSKGYTKDNIVFCCRFINYMKSTLTYDQFIHACAKIVDHYNKRQKSFDKT